MGEARPRQGRRFRRIGSARACVVAWNFGWRPRLLRQRGGEEENRASGNRRGGGGPGASSIHLSRTAGDPDPLDKPHGGWSPGMAKLRGGGNQDKFIKTRKELSP